MLLLDVLPPIYPYFFQERNKGLAQLQSWLSFPVIHFGSSYGCNLLLSLWEAASHKVFYLIVQINLGLKQLKGLQPFLLGEAPQEVFEKQLYLIVDDIDLDPIIFGVLFVVLHELFEIPVDQLHSLGLNEHLQPVFLHLELRFPEVGNDSQLVKIAVVIIKLENIFNIKLLL